MKYVLIFLLLPFITKAQQTQVNTDSLMTHIWVLASDSLHGRLPGTEGFDKALGYSMAFFEKHGIEPAGRDFWPQQVPMDINRIDSAYFLIETGRDMMQLVPGVDFSVRGYSGSGNVDADVVFCGYGTEADYEGIDVKGKIVLVFKSNPSFNNDLPPFTIRRHADIAYTHGAKAIVFVSQPNQSNPQKPIGSVMHGEGPMHEDLPQLQISVEKADYLLSNSGYRLSELQSLIDSTHRPHSIDVNKKASVMVQAVYSANGFTQNIVGVLHGNDPKLKNEYILIGAHLDHVGTIGNSVLYPGANDNASGSAAVLELARVFSLQKGKLKRSIIFVLFGSEEKGLVGAGYLAEHLPVDKASIVAAFNMDCIGYGDSLMVGNGKSCPDLWSLADSTSSELGNRISIRTWAGGGADLTPLFEQGIPGLYFVTTNSYEHLHLPTDKPETINQALYSDMVKLVAAITKRLVIDMQ